MGIQALNDKGNLLFIVSGWILRSFSTWVSETTFLSLLFVWWWAFRFKSTQTGLMNNSSSQSVWIKYWILNIVVIWIIVLTLHITTKRTRYMGVATYVWHLVCFIWLGVGVIWSLPSITFYLSIAHLIILLAAIIEHLSAEAVSV